MMRLKMPFRTDMHGYTTSLFGEMIPGELNRTKKVREQIKAIHQKEADYIKSMSGEVKITKLKENE
jgi:hypothetical protein